MESHREKTGKFKSRLLAWLFVGLASMVLVVCLVFSFIQPDRLAPVGIDTTFLTSPLDERGRPDYRQWMLNELGAEFPSEQNGIRYILPFVVDPEEDSFDTYVAHLGIDKSSLPEMKGYERWYNDEWNGAAIQAVLEQVSDAKIIGDLQLLETVCFDLTPDSIPWKRADLPGADQWLKGNAAVIDAVRLASTASVVYFPPLETVEPSATSSTLGVDVTLGIANSGFRRIFSANAMLKCGEMDFDGAISDIAILDDYLSRVRYFAIAGQNIRTVIEEYCLLTKVRIAQAAANDASHYARRIYEAIPVSPERLRWVLPSLQQERVFQLASVENPTWRQQTDEINEIIGADRFWVLKRLNERSVDLEFLQRGINSLADLVEDTVVATDAKSLLEAQTKLQAEINGHKDTAKSKSLQAMGFINRATRSEVLTSEMLAENGVFGNDLAINLLESRMRYAVLRIAAGIAVHRAEHGNTLPDDLASIRAFSVEEFGFFEAFDVVVEYEKSGEGAYLLKAFFKNGEQVREYEWKWDSTRDTAAELKELAQPLVERYGELLEGVLPR